jgi:hypothetical protein
LLSKENGATWWNSRRFEEIGIAIKSGHWPHEFDELADEEKATVIAYYRTLGKMAAVEQERQDEEAERMRRRHGA